MNELMELENLKIEDMIYQIRGKQVMLASDVAKLYHSESRIINQVVKRNIQRFPEDFCFQLTKEEFLNLNSKVFSINDDEASKSQIVILNKSNNSRGKHSKYLPYVFT